MDKNRNAVQLFNKHAGLYQEKYMDVDLYGETFDFFLENIGNKHAAVLDIACGPGNITKHLLDKCSSLNITGIDLSANMIALAKENNPTAEFSVMDCREIEKIGLSFDAIVCGFCLPYLDSCETEKIIADASALLHESGLFYLSTIEDDYSKSGLKKGSTGDEIFMHFYKAEYLNTLLKKNKFEILFSKTIKNPADEVNNTSDLIIVSKKYE